MNLFICLYEETCYALTLDEEEFCQGCLKDPDFYKIVQGGVDKLKTDQQFVQKLIK